MIPKRRPAKLSEIHLAILENGAEGYCTNYQWAWVLGGTSVTRQVKTLIKEGLVEASYPRGGGYVSATDRGRRALAEARGE